MTSGFDRYTLDIIATVGLIVLPIILVIYIITHQRRLKNILLFLTRKNVTGYCSRCFEDEFLEISDTRELHYYCSNCYTKVER